MKIYSSIKPNFKIGLILFFLALFFRWIFLFLATDFSLTPTCQDQKDYYEIGLAIANGEQVDIIKRPPLEPLLVALTVKIFGDSITFLRMMHGLISALSVVLVYFLAINSFSHSVAMGAAILSIIHPLSLIFSSEILSENLYTFFLLATFLSIQGINSANKFRKSIIGGILFGLSMLTRPVVLFTMILSFLYLKKRLIQKRDFVIAIMLMLIGFILSLTPWLIFTWYKTSAFPVICNDLGGRTLYASNNPNSKGFYVEIPLENAQDLSVIEANKIYYQKALHFIFTHPQQFFLNGIIKSLALWYPFSPDYDFLLGMIFPLAVLAFFRLWKVNSEFRLYFAPIFGVMINSFIFYGLNRFRLPIMPFLFIAGTAFALWEWENSDLARKKILWQLLGLLLAVNIFISLFSVQIRAIIKAIFGWH